MISVKGKYLSEYPELVSELDLLHKDDLEVYKIKAGSNTKLKWVCQICKESYLRCPNYRTRGGSACPKKECMLIKRSKTNNTKFGWKPKYRIPKRIPTINPNIPEPSEKDVEVWRSVSEKLGLSKYYVSSLGRIKNKKSGYIHASKPQCNGYIHKSLRTDIGIKSVMVHRIVASTFIPNPENKPTVNHINTIRHDNRVVNLEWATHREQCFKENRTEVKHTIYNQIDQHDLMGNFIKTWNKGIDIENELGIQRKNVSAVVRGKRKSAGGFKWKYKKVKDLDGEIWKEIKDSKSYVSNLGRVKMKIGSNPNYGTLIKNGYRNTKVIINNKYKSFLIHRLVCLAFIENPKNKPIVNHKDENRSNNKLENLEWATHSENVNHSLCVNRIRRNHRSKIIQCIDKETGVIINEYPSINQAGKNSEITGQTIYDRCIGKYNQKGSCIWKFKN